MSNLDIKLPETPQKVVCSKRKRQDITPQFVIERVEMIGVERREPNFAKEISDSCKPLSQSWPCVFKKGIFVDSDYFAPHVDDFWIRHNRRTDTVAVAKIVGAVTQDQTQVANCDRNEVTQRNSCCSRCLVFDDSDSALHSSKVAQWLQSGRWVALRRALRVDRDTCVREMFEAFEALHCDDTNDQIVHNFVAFLRDCIDANRFNVVRAVVDACDKKFFSDVIHSLNLAQLVRDGYFAAVGALYVRADVVGIEKAEVWCTAADAIQFSSMTELMFVVGEKLTPDFVFFLFDKMPYEWFVPPQVCDETFATSLVAMCSAIVKNRKKVCGADSSVEEACYEAMRYVTELIEPQTPAKRVEILQHCVRTVQEVEPELFVFFASKLKYQKSVCENGGCRVAQHRLKPIKRSRFC